ncbi:hypothetical protein [Methylobacterium sp. A54F]
MATAVPRPEEASAPEWMTVFPRLGRVETSDGRAFELSVETLMAGLAADGIVSPVDVNQAADAAGLSAGPPRRSTAAWPCVSRRASCS